jgi:hypothetical protein
MGHACIRDDYHCTEPLRFEVITYSSCPILTNIKIGTRSGAWQKEMKQDGQTDVGGMYR